MSAPRPGPISTIASPARGAIAATMAAITPSSIRKFWLKRLRGRCGTAAQARELGRELDRRDQAADFAAPRAGEIERGAVIDRGAHDRQPERHVDARAEARVLEHGQALVVVHREHRIGFAQALGIEKRVGGQRPDDVVARGAQRVEHRRDDFDFLAAEMAGFAGVRIQARDEHARPRDAEARDQVAAQDLERLGEAFARDRRRHVAQREVRRRERDAHAAADQHHDDARRAGALGEELGVAGERQCRRR